MDHCRVDALSTIASVQDARGDQSTIQLPSAVYRVPSRNGFQSPAMRMSAERAGSRLKVVQVSFHFDAQQRNAETLLEVWPTLRGVAAGVANAGVDVTIVQAAARRETLTRDGVTFHFIQDPGILPGPVIDRLPSLRLPRRIVRLVASLDPDVVHLHGFIHPVGIWFLSRALREVPVLVQDHASRAPAGWRRHVLRIACSGLGGVVFTARQQATPFVHAGVWSHRLPVFEAIEGSSAFSPGDQVTARRETGLRGDPCLFWSGHLSAGKDPLTMLDAFSRAAPRLPDARLWCCFGTAPLGVAVEQRIAEDEILRARVTLVGQRPHREMEQLFRAADLYLQTSRFEGSGYSLIEALSCGTPAVVTDIPATRRIVNDGVVGALCPVGDAAAFSDAIVAWAGRDRGQDRRAARAWFEAELSFDAIGRQLRAAYEAVARPR
jgi:glycosyltransferase involved in cell wall biosynthesis